MTLRRFVPKGHFSRASFAYLGLFTLVIIYFELIQVWTNAFSWKLGQDDAEIRILLVADPQLLGERGELPGIGMFTRWHADRYVAQNYKAALYRTKPQIVIFLGDLFDEGATAAEAEAARYLRRFHAIFQLGEYSKSDGLMHIFLPGDNDVGGEGSEKIDSNKIQWFNSSVGDLQSPVFFRAKDLVLKFSQTNFFLPFLQSSASIDQTTDTSSVHFALSHYTCLNAYPTCTKVLTTLKPGVILSAHTHKSSYNQYNPEGHILYTLPNILEPGLDPVQGTTESAKKMGVDLSTDFLRFDLRKANGHFHEIVTPTCSYRMGVPNMGFGLVTMNSTGDQLKYQVLWLPNGFKPLYVYITFYIVSKVIFTPWVLWKVLLFGRRLLRGHAGSDISPDKTHLV